MKTAKQKLGGDGKSFKYYVYLFKRSRNVDMLSNALHAFDDMHVKKKRDINQLSLHLDFFIPLHGHPCLIYYYLSFWKQASTNP